MHLSTPVGTGGSPLSRRCLSTAGSRQGTPNSAIQAFPRCCYLNLRLLHEIWGTSRENFLQVITRHFCLRAPPTLWSGLRIGTLIVARFSEAFSQTIDAALHGRLSRWQGGRRIGRQCTRGRRAAKLCRDWDGRGRVVAVAKGASAQSSAPDARLLSNSAGIGHKDESVRR